MKFLVDRCAGPGLADWLRVQGHDVLEARQFEPDPGDRALLERAGSEGRISFESVNLHQEAEQR